MPMYWSLTKQLLPDSPTLSGRWRLGQWGWDPESGTGEIRGGGGGENEVVWGTLGSQVGWWGGRRSQRDQSKQEEWRLFKTLSSNCMPSPVLGQGRGKKHTGCSRGAYTHFCGLQMFQTPPGNFYQSGWAPSGLMGQNLPLPFSLSFMY